VATPERLMKLARWSTGLENFGDATFLEGLEALTTSLRDEAQLSQAGRIVAFFNLANLLSVRLRLIDYRAQRTEIVQQQIERPLIITGLPRTGTTILHELIAQDPAFRSPATWEVTRPVPPAKSEHYNTDSRIASVDRLLGFVEKVSPGFQPIHALGARLPQECVYLLSSAFYSEQFSYMYNVPRYRQWLLEQDMTSAYRWHAWFLQHMQVDFPGGQWVLKTPAHLPYLNHLLTQYPDATVVWTHRKPMDAIASFASLTSTLRSGFSDAIDPARVGEQELRHGAAVVAQGMAHRSALDSRRFFDVSFAAICTDPIAVIGDLYDQLDQPFTADAQQRMCNYLKQRPRHLYGEHQYTPQQFGLDESQEEAMFADYIGKYGHAWAT
jgi:hypothetical protein